MVDNNNKGCVGFMTSKDEINQIITKYHLNKDISLTSDSELKWIVENIHAHNPFEKPDAYIENSNVIYGIEHFQISLYKANQKGDISQIARGSQDNREKMCNDREFDFKPSIDNLLEALEKNMASHAKSFIEYRNNLASYQEEYRLIIFIEDSTESGYIVHKRETKPINPLLLDKVVEILLKYENEVWAILLSTGNEYEKTLTGCTIGELKGMARDNKLLNSLDYTSFESERKVHVSNKSRSEDKNTITLRLFDRGTRS